MPCDESAHDDFVFLAGGVMSLPTISSLPAAGPVRPPLRPENFYDTGRRRGLSILGALGSQDGGRFLRVGSYRGVTLLPGADIGEVSSCCYVL